MSSSDETTVCDRCGCACLDGTTRVRVLRTGSAAGVHVYVLCGRCGDRLLEHLSRATPVLNGTR
jgi:hypothetical protein